MQLRSDQILDDPPDSRARTRRCSVEVPLPGVPKTVPASISRAIAGRTVVRRNLYSLSSRPSTGNIDPGECVPPSTRDRKPSSS